MAQHDERYTFDECIYSTVTRCKDRDGNVVVLKEQRHSLCDEYETMMAFNHPNILRPLGQYTCPLDGKCYMVLPSAQEDLLERLQRHGALAPADARFYMLQLLDGLRHVWSKGYAHYDIKAENLLIFTDEKDPRRGRPVLADFGFALGKDQEDTWKGQRFGTEGWLAPEMDKDGVQPGRGISVDMWGLGLMLYGMVTGAYANHREGKLVMPEPGGRLGLIDFNKHADLWNLLQWLLQWDFKMRPKSAQDVLNHPWMTPDVEPPRQLKSPGKKRKRDEAPPVRSSRVCSSPVCSSPVRSSTSGGLCEVDPNRSPSPPPPKKRPRKQRVIKYEGYEEDKEDNK